MSTALCLAMAVVGGHDQCAPGYAPAYGAPSYGAPSYSGSSYSGSHYSSPTRYGAPQSYGYAPRPAMRFQSGYGPGTPQVQRGHVVHMTDRGRFEPAHITVHVGETVEWRNVSGKAHTVTADPNLAANPAHVVLPEGAEPIHSEDVPPGGSYTYTFQTPGTYYYVCLPHEGMGMAGIVVVKPAGEEAHGHGGGAPQAGGGRAGY